MVTYSKELALDDYEFELLVEGASRIDCDYQRLEALLVVFIGGRLGFRAGEINHMSADWIDWRNRRIEIPYHDGCTKGKDGGICGYCRQAASQRAEYSQISMAEARLESLQEQLAQMPNLPGAVQRQLQTAHILHIDSDLTEDALDRQVAELLENASAVDDVDAVRDALDDVARTHKNEVEITQDAAEDLMWQAKTETAARSVPFDFSPRAELYIERYFDQFDEFQTSHGGIHRRLDKALEHAEELTTDSTHGHGLRATAATHHAASGLKAIALQGLMGWAQISTARNYVRATPDHTQNQLNQLG